MFEGQTGESKVKHDTEDRGWGCASISCQHTMLGPFLRVRPAGEQISGGPPFLSTAKTISGC